jgi:hypothetical protein
MQARSDQRFREQDIKLDQIREIRVQLDEVRAQVGEVRAQVSEVRGLVAKTALKQRARQP